MHFLTPIVDSEYTHSEIEGSEIRGSVLKNHPRDRDRDRDRVTSVKFKKIKGRSSTEALIRRVFLDLNLPGQDNL